MTKQTVHKLTSLVVREADEELENVVLVGGPRDGETWEVSKRAVVFYPPILDQKLPTQTLRYQKVKGVWTYQDTTGEPVEATFVKDTVRVRR